MGPSVRQVVLLRRGAYSFVNAEAASYVAAMSVQPNDTRKAVIDILIGSLKSAGVWTKLDVLYLLAAHDAQAARINAKNPGTFNATAVSSPTFTADRGYTFNGTSSYLNSNFNPNTAGGQYTASSAHAAAWSLTSAQSNGSLFGALESGSTGYTYLRPRTTSNLAVALINDNSDAVELSGSNSDGSGHFVLRRSSTSVSILRNASSLATASHSLDSRPVWPLFIGAFSSAGTPASFTNYELSAAHMGGYLTDQNVTDTKNALQTYLTAVGALP